MGADTIQLTAVTIDNEESSQPRRSWLSFGPRTEKKHRIHDYVARLQRDLTHTQHLNEELSANLSAQIEETTRANERIAELTALVADLEHRLRLAENANVANRHTVDFSFQQRQVHGPEDQATMPVPQVELLGDGPSVKVVASDAATALVERVTANLPRLQSVGGETTPVHDPWDLESNDDDDEMHNQTQSAWRARRTNESHSVTWGGRSQPQTIQASAFSDSVFRVIPLQQRGAEQPSLRQISG